MGVVTLSTNLSYKYDYEANKYLFPLGVTELGKC